jgi:RimJ/RimL family protein N-acetyltransferase
MSRIYLETDQVRIRQWETEDAEQLYGIMSDSRVHTYTGDAPWSAQRTERYIDFMMKNRFSTYTFLHGACVRKADDALMGLVGLNPYLPNCPEMTIQLGMAFQGLGFGTEIGRVLLGRVFVQTAIESVYCMLDPDHRASIRTMEKIGMTYMGRHHFRGKPAVFYVSARTAVGNCLADSDYPGCPTLHTA